MMKEVFADTVYWIALLNPSDSLHHQARSISASLGQVRLVTTEMVLCEFLNSLASRGAGIRRKAVDTVDRLRADPNVLVIPGTSELFLKALERYRKRPDKEWGLTDCASFIVMESRTIQDVLTHDEHFAQAGFAALL